MICSVVFVKKNNECSCLNFAEYLQYIQLVENDLKSENNHSDISEYVDISMEYFVVKIFKIAKLKTYFRIYCFIFLLQLIQYFHKRCKAFLPDVKKIQ